MLNFRTTSVAVLCHHLLESLGMSGNIRDRVGSPCKQRAFSGSFGNATRTNLTSNFPEIMLNCQKVEQIAEAFKTASKTTLSAL